MSKRIEYRAQYCDCGECEDGDCCAFDSYSGSQWRIAEKLSRKLATGWVDSECDYQRIERVEITVFAQMMAHGFEEGEDFDYECLWSKKNPLKYNEKGDRERWV